MSDLEKPPKHLWPRSLLQIAEWCGEEAALAIWQAYPGVHVHVPKVMTENHPLAQVMGFEAASLLSQRSGRVMLQVPRAYKAQQVLRNFIIRKASREGRSMRDLALQYKLSERQIIAICSAELVKPAQQVDLFDFD